MKVNAVLGEGISLEVQVCSKIDLRNVPVEGSRRLSLLRTSEKKNAIIPENVADRRFKS